MLPEHGEDDGNAAEQLSVETDAAGHKVSSPHSKGLFVSLLLSEDFTKNYIIELDQITVSTRKLELNENNLQKIHVCLSFC